MSCYPDEEFVVLFRLILGERRKSVRISVHVESWHVGSWFSVGLTLFEDSFRFLDFFRIISEKRDPTWDISINSDCDDIFIGVGSSDITSTSYVLSGDVERDILWERVAEFGFGEERLG